MSRRNLLTAAALLALCFGLAARLAPDLESLRARRAGPDSLLAVLFGDGRRLFANHFFLKADSYFHSGYYPSMFDTVGHQDEHHAAHVAEDTGMAEAHEEEEDFLGPPRDWIEAFGRNFTITKHTHLDEHKHDPHEKSDGHADHDEPANLEREILPWLRLSAQLDPERVETYTVAAYWLRTKMNRVNEAEQFLREGLRANPDSPEILFELGRIHAESRKDDARARNLWEAALAKWQRFEAPKPEPNKFIAQRLRGELSLLEVRAGNLPKAIAHLEALKLLSPKPADIQKQIDELRQKAAAAPQK